MPVAEIAPAPEEEAPALPPVEAPAGTEEVPALPAAVVEEAAPVPLAPIQAADLALVLYLVLLRLEQLEEATQQPAAAGRCVGSSPAHSANACTSPSNVDGYSQVKCLCLGLSISNALSSLLPPAGRW